MSKMKLFYLIIFLLFRYLESFYQDNLHKLDDLDTAEAIFQSQSDTCKDSDDIQKIQCFRELPLAQYEVLEGGDVMMRCRVAHQKGKLQWAFKGKMLGFERNIPNYPRMRMPGNPKIGDHSLFIENVQVSDSGTYECQLSPSASQPPRRRMTNLQVLRPPLNPVIYKDSILAKENISVSSRKEEADFVISLICLALNGNPGPTFLWSINESNLESASLFRSIATLITKANESASVLMLRSDQLRNNDIIKCGVFNTATTKRANISERIIVTKISVVKRILPGPLRFKEISSIVKTVTIQERELFRLSCITSDPGDPPIKLTWKSTLDNYPINDYIISNDNNPIFSESTIIIPSIDSRWHSQSITCSGTQDGQPTAKSISKIVIVKHLPKKLDITAVSMTTNNSLNNGEVVYYSADVMINLVCFTSPYFSNKFSIVWSAKYYLETKWKTITTATDNIIDVDAGRLQLQKSVLTISQNLLHNHSLKMPLQVACVMQSRDSNNDLRREIKLEHYVQSNSPVITVNDERKSTMLTNGQSTKIKCSIIGGHPIPELLLVDETDHQIEGRTYYQSGLTYLQAIIEVKSHDHGKKFRCITTSKATLDFVSLSSEVITLTIAIPPQQLTMVAPDVGPGYRAYHNISFSCFTDSSFPQSKIEWRWHYSCEMPNIKQSRINPITSFNIHQFCESRIIENNIISSFNPSTQSTISTATLKLLPFHHFTFLECRVLPNIKWPYFNNQFANITQLKVQYLPMIPKELENMYIVEEGQNLSITINASANPPINGYTWLLNKQTVTRKSQVELKVDKFSVANAQPDMMGNYTLLLENHLGKNEFNFFLNVTFSPKLLGPSVETIKLNPLNEYRQKSAIMCSAQANPFKDQVRVQWTRERPLVMSQNDLLDILRGDSLFSVSPRVHCAKDNWSRGNVSINCISLGAIEIVSSLQVMPMDYRYIGTYKCIFSNNIKPSSAVKTTNLVFPTIPVPLQNYRKSEFAAKIGSKTEIACYFIAYPNPTIEWRRSLNIRCTDDTRKYATSISSPQTGLIKAVLAIRETNDSDIGTYQCSASNQYGKSSQSVILEGPRVPTQPMNVTVVNVTDTSVTIGWILGFNGGSKQTIELRWKPTDIGRYTEYVSVELEEIENNDVQFYSIIDLHNDREYEIIIQSTNRYTTLLNNPSSRLIFKTMKFEPEGEGALIQSDGRRSIIDANKGKRIQDKTNTNNILIIILLSTIGGLLICLKIGLLVYFFRKRKFKQQLSTDKISSHASHHTKDGYLNSADSMKMRVPSLIRSGHGSIMYAQSISDHMSQNGSENGLKINYYKTISDDSQPSYISPELDVVASAIRKNNFDVNGISSNFYPAYVLTPESSSLTGYHDPYVSGYYANISNYNHQIPFHSVDRVPSNNPSLTHHSISTNYQRRFDGNNYQSSAISMSTASGDSNHSRSPHRKLIRYSPMNGQSGAPSTVEEYLSSTNSGSDYNRFGSSNFNEGYASNLMSSFRINKKIDYSGPAQEEIPAKDSLLRMANNRNQLDNGVDLQYSVINDRCHVFANSENDRRDQHFDCPREIDNTRPYYCRNIPKLSYVDLISHSSPSVIRLTGSISENL